MLNAKPTILLILLSISLFTSPADANQSYIGEFNTLYPNSPLANKNDCTICHSNNYLQDLVAAAKDFTAIENLDSDGDGIINIDEIDAGTHPGVSEGYSYYLPYFTGQMNHWTGIGLRNCSPDTSATVTSFIYGSDGNLLESNRTSIVARGHDVFTIGNGQPDEGWIRISSTQPLAGLCFVATTGTTNYMADIPFVSELSGLLYIPHVGQGPVYDTTVMVCNPNSSDTIVTLTFVDQQGSVLDEETQLVKANGSWKYELQNLLDSSTANYGSLEISASNGLVAFALYNNLKKDGSYSYAGISAVIPP